MTKEVSRSEAVLAVEDIDNSYKRWLSINTSGGMS